MHPAVPFRSSQQVLKERFGFDQFREGQAPVIERLLAGRSALAIFPTGAGKSLCYQLPALMFEGLTLVVSPLIALMKDQIDFLQSRGVPAGRLDSSMDAESAGQTLRGLRDGSLKLLYVAPERLANERFLHTLSRLKVAMMAVDEAHCISEWGHNFRPDYLKLAALAKRLAIPRVLALTATATPPVAEQIARAFGIAEADVVRTGFYRPNLSIAVTPCAASERDALLLERLKRRPRGPTIVYVTLQRTAESVAAHLSAHGFKARAYHAGLDADERHAVQDAFMASSDAIVVATIAFGMGIDKSDIRYVYHYNLPKSLENYAQEIGRAGRDGQRSLCETFACGDDRVTLENFATGDTPEPAALHAIVNEVMGLGDAFDVSMSQLASAHDVRPLVVETLLTYLQLDGLLESTGAFYNEFKLRWRGDEGSTLAKFDAARAAFLRRVLSHARRGRAWLTLDVHTAAEATGEPRERIVAALGYLEEHGSIELGAVGVRNGFRRLRVEADFHGLAERQCERFARRQARDLERLRRVIEFCETPGCRTARLLDYFGECLPRETCGHCADCAAGGEPAGGSGAVGRRTLPHEPGDELGSELREAVRAARVAGRGGLATARQVARFLCGISSPVIARLRLGRHALFGRFAGTPFAEVLATVERLEDAANPSGDSIRPARGASSGDSARGQHRPALPPAVSVEPQTSVADPAFHRSQGCAPSKGRARVGARPPAPVRAAAPTGAAAVPALRTAPAGRYAHGVGRRSGG